MNKFRFQRTLAITAALLVQFGAFISGSRGAAGDVDLSFDAGSGLNADVTAIAVQNDGKVIVGGNFSTVRGLSRVGIARLNGDGSGDSSFGVAGPGHSYGAVGAIALQPDGKVIFSHQEGLTRLNVDGSVDQSFDAGEINSIAHYDGPIYGPSAIAVQPDGKVLIGGPGDLRRLHADGSFDSSFAASDRYVEAIALQSDGKVLIGGMEPKIARLNADGSVDSSFQPAEDQIAGIVASIILQPDGKVLLAGNVSVDGINEAVVRLNVNGTVDNTFNSEAANGFSKIARQADGRIVIAGELFGTDGTPRKGVARLNSNGSADLTFDRSVNADNVVAALALQADGRVLIGGDFTSLGSARRHRIARCNADGTLDGSFDPGASVDSFSSVALQADGKILIGGVFTFIHGAKRYARERLNSDGSPDVTFIPDVFAPDYGFTGGEMDYNQPKSLLAQADGKVLIGGVHHFFVTDDEGSTHFTRMFLHRVHADGSRDIGFTAPEMEVRDLAQQPDGKILVAGNIVVNGTNYAVVRLNPNGSLDGTFNLGMASAHGSSVALQADGKILVGGFQFLRRLNSNGSIDSSFSVGTDGVAAIALQVDGRILLSHRNNVESTGRISRLNPDGNVDATFQAELGLYGSVDAITIQPDGMILLGGDFTTVNGAVRPRLARLFGDSKPPVTTLHSFTGIRFENGGAYPEGELIIDGETLYGTTHGHGDSGGGTVFKLDADGTGFTNLHVFADGTDGAHPRSGVILSGNTLYGTTEGFENSRPGKIFAVNTDGTAFRVLHAFSAVAVTNADGAYPRAGLVLVGTKLYGATSGGGSFGGGTVFAVNTDGTGFSVLHEFAAYDRFSGINNGGGSPLAGLIASGATLYGTTSRGGAGGSGTVFKLNTDGTGFSTLHEFPVFDPNTSINSGGYYPEGVLTLSGGTIYGTAAGGGSSGGGTVFKLNVDGTGFATLHNFPAVSPPEYLNGEGAGPLGGVILSGNVLYGTASYGGTSGGGTAFSVHTDGSGFEVLSSFPAESTDAAGTGPSAGLLLSDNKLYGTTVSGGLDGKGTVFRLSLSQPVSTPEIAIEHPAGTPLVDGAGSVNFGSIAPGNFADRAFTVRNSGDALLTGISAMIGGTNASAFAVTAQPAASVAEFNGSTTFIVRFTPTSRGTHSATLQIASNDADENPFDIALSGSGANLAPTATADSAATAYQTPVDIHALANDSDPEGDVLALVGASSPAHGAAQIVVTGAGQRIRYTPAAGFSGSDTFTYNIGDGFGGSATGTVTVTVAAKPRGKKTISGGAVVMGAGEPGTGVPAGATWKTFGIPSIASNGAIAFGATIATPTGLVPVIYRSSSDEEPVAGAEHVVAGQGDPAPGAPGTTFGNFKDPLLNSEGNIVFIATLRGTPAGSNGGIWKHYAGDGPGAATLVARSGDVPAGVPGARWKAFTSVVVSDGEAGDEIIAFTATMTPGPGGVRSHNDLGLWLADASGIRIALREGALVTIGSAPKKVKSFVALQALPGAAGQGNGISASQVLARLKFEDGSHGIVSVRPNEKGTEVATVALAGEAPAGLSANLAVLGLPTQSSAGEACFTATLAKTGRGSDTAIFQSMGSGVELVAREGEEALAGTGVAFGTFTALASDSAGRIAFSAALRGGAANAANDTAMFLQNGGTRDMIAREGGQPPGVPPGARWASFPSLALPDPAGGPIFIGKLVTPAPGQLNPAQITRRNNAGLWAMDASGTLQLIVRTGDVFDAERRITALTLLANVPGSPAQTRSFTATGQVIYRVTLDDGSQHVVTVPIP